MTPFQKFFALATLPLVASLTMHAQQSAEPRPLPPGSSVVSINADEAAKLTDSLKDARHLADAHKIDELTIKATQAELAQIETAQKTWAEGFRAEVDKIHTAHKWGADVQFDYERLAFVKAAPPAPAATTNK